MYVSQEWSSRRAFPDAPIWNRTPDQQDEKELLEFAAKIMQNSEAQRHLHFRETDHIENMVVFHSNLLQMENALPAVCAQKNARQVPFRWTIRR